jgi:hypothetical protein
LVRTFGSHSVFATAISAGRPARVRATQLIAGPLTWIVPSSEVSSYGEQGASCVVPQHGAGVAAARNAALVLADDRGLPCIQVDDDLVRIRRRDGSPVAFDEAWSLAFDALAFTPFRLCGFPPTDNPFFSRGGILTSGFVCGSAIAVRPCSLRFDEAFRLKEDYDYTAQHIARHGGVCRVEDVLWTFGHYTNPGGAVAIRSAAREAEAVARLKSKWPGWFRDNPRRPNEVLMRVPNINKRSLQ